MSLEQLSHEASRVGGKWVKLNSRADGVVEGRVLAFDVIDRTTPKGDVVYSNKTKKPRKVWRFVLEVPDESDPVNLDLNESGQKAVAEALRKSGAQPNVGDTLKIVVAKDREDEYAQPTYAAQWIAAPQGLSVPEPEEDPFATAGVTGTSDDERGSAASGSLRLVQTPSDDPFA